MHSFHLEMQSSENTPSPVLSREVRVAVRRCPQISGCVLVPYILAVQIFAALQRAPDALWTRFRAMYVDFLKRGADCTDHECVPSQTQCINSGEDSNKYFCIRTRVLCLLQLSSYSLLGFVDVTTFTGNQSGFGSAAYIAANYAPRYGDVNMKLLLTFLCSEEIRFVFLELSTSDNRGDSMKRLRVLRPFYVKHGFLSGDSPRLPKPVKDFLQRVKFGTPQSKEFTGCFLDDIPWRMLMAHVLS